MSMVKGLTTCAAQGCPNKPDGYAHLCGLHNHPGLSMEIDGSSRNHLLVRAARRGNQHPAFQRLRAVGDKLFSFT